MYLCVCVLSSFYLFFQSSKYRSVCGSILSPSSALIWEPWFFVEVHFPDPSCNLKDEIVHHNDSLRILPHHACQAPMTRYRGQLDYYILSLPLSIKPNAIRNTWLHQHISFNQMWLSQSLVFSRQIKDTSACIINVTTPLLKWFVRKEAPLEQNLGPPEVFVLSLLVFIIIKHPGFVCKTPASLSPLTKPPCCQAEFGFSLIRMISLSHCYHYDLGN